MLTSRSKGGASVTSRPRSRTVPAVGRSKPAIIRRTVVLPEPEGPRSVTNSPSPMLRSMPSTATTGAPPLENSLRSPTSCTAAPARAVTASGRALPTASGREAPGTESIATRVLRPARETRPGSREPMAPAVTAQGPRARGQVLPPTATGRMALAALRARSRRSVLGRAGSHRPASSPCARSRDTFTAYQGSPVAGHGTSAADRSGAGSASRAGTASADNVDR